MLRRRWLGCRKSIWPVKTWVVRYWRGYLSAARCKWFAYGPADATATPSYLASSTSRMVLPFWCTHIVLKKGCSVGVCLCYICRSIHHIVSMFWNDVTKATVMSVPCISCDKLTWSFHAVCIGVNKETPSFVKLFTCTFCDVAKAAV